MSSIGSAFAVGTRSNPTLTDSSPSVCPACQSSSVTTAAKTPDADSYWRCQRCGEVWNVARRHGVNRGAGGWR